MEMILSLQKMASAATAAVADSYISRLCSSQSWSCNEPIVTRAE